MGAKSTSSVSSLPLAVAAPLLRLMTIMPSSMRSSSSAGLVVITAPPPGLFLAQGSAHEGMKGNKAGQIAQPVLISAAPLLLAGAVTG